MNVTEEFLHKIRQLDGFNNAIITNIDVFTRKKVVCFYLVTDLAYSESVLPEAEEIAEAYMPAGFAAVVHAEKRTPDEALLRQEIMRFMKSRFPAASAFLEEKYIEVEKRESGALFCLCWRRASRRCLRRITFWTRWRNTCKAPFAARISVT